MGLVPFLKRPHRAPSLPPPHEDTGEQGHQKRTVARRGICRRLHLRLSGLQGWEEHISVGFMSHSVYGHLS